MIESFHLIALLEISCEFVDVLGMIDMLVSGDRYFVDTDKYHVCVCVCVCVCARHASVSACANVQSVEEPSV